MLGRSVLGQAVVFDCAVNVEVLTTVCVHIGGVMRRWACVVFDSVVGRTFVKCMM